MKVASMSVELIDKMGTDLSVVNAARVSFSKVSKFEIEPETNKERLNEKDSKLIKFLADHNHFTPFCHAFLSFRVKAPIFVARQLVKHQVGLSWNEVSRRYVDDEPEFWFPEVWRGRPEGNIKQGSAGVVESMTEVSPITGETWTLPLANGIELHSDQCLRFYQALLSAKVAPEQARMVLPLNTMTEWIWSGSLLAFIRVCKLRCDAHAQEETREIGNLIRSVLRDTFPWSTAAFLES